LRVEMTHEGERCVRHASAVQPERAPVRACVGAGGREGDTGTQVHDTGEADSGENESVADMAAKPQEPLVFFFLLSVEEEKTLCGNRFFRKSWLAVKRCVFSTR
jgi:hypothetical protein